MDNKELKEFIDKIVKEAIDKYFLENSETVVVDALILFLKDRAYQVPSELDFSEMPLINLLEQKRSLIPVPGTKYMARIDPPRGIPSPGNLKHVHLYNRGQELFAMNVDGSAHDGYHKYVIPNNPKLMDFLRQKGFIIPKDNLIEMSFPSLKDRQLLFS